MNFKLFLIALLFCGCGVKSDPKPPSHTILPSVEAPFTQGIEQQSEDNNKDKKKK